VCVCVCVCVYFQLSSSDGRIHVFVLCPYDIMSEINILTGIVYLALSFTGSLILGPGKPEHRAGSGGSKSTHLLVSVSKKEERKRPVTKYALQGRVPSDLLLPARPHPGISTISQLCHPWLPCVEYEPWGGEDLRSEP
jgi:hypothetical protein